MYSKTTSIITDLSKSRGQGLLYVTPGLNINYMFCPYTVFKCLVCISEQRATDSLHNIKRLDGFAKLRKATVSFVMYVCRSVCPFVPTEEIGSHRMNFRQISYLSIFRKSVLRIQGSLKCD